MSAIDTPEPAAAAEPAPEPPLEWTVNPWRENPGRSTLGVLICALAAATLPALGVAPLTGVALGVALALALAPAFWVLRCRVDGAGVARRLLFVWERRPWERIGRARLDRFGLWVSPHAVPSRLDPFRGLWLPVAGSSEPALIEALRGRLRSHGL